MLLLKDWKIVKEKKDCKNECKNMYYDMHVLFKRVICDNILTYENGQRTPLKMMLYDTLIPGSFVYKK